MKPLYLDYNATTPLDPSVLEAMLPHLQEHYGNPSSIHQLGRQARSFLDEYRYRMADWWQCKPSEVVFTGGGTESNNLAVFGTARLRKPKGRHLICSAIEHHAVLHAYQHLEEKEGFEVSYCPVEPTGRVDPDHLRSLIRPETQLVSVMAANNETGTLQPVAEIGRLCRDHGVLFHTDAVQWFGKEPVEHIHQFEADLVTVCGHKCHGPKGAGALFIRSPLLPEKILFGGAHENERRAGTENVAGIAGLVQALEMHARTPVFRASPIEQAALTCRRILESLEGVTLLSPESGSLVNTLTFTVENADSIGLLAALDLEGICASSGSACSVGSLEPSHVALAMGASREEANAMVRFSFGRENDLEQVAFMAERLPDILSRCQHTHKSANSL